uniref:Uncharacterized protein n=1 Tax=Salvator merianae TaxID=96440 RepID=A0A8D0E5R0_SALMN
MQFHLTPVCFVNVPYVTLMRKFWPVLAVRILKINIPFKPEFFLLGIIENKFEGVHMLLQNMVTSAIIVYAQKWKDNKIPMVDN